MPVSIIERYKKNTRKSNKLYTRAKRVFLDHGTRAVFKYDPYPVYIKRGEGSRVFDVDGNEYIDFCFNFTSLILGHNHPSIKEAVRGILERGPPSGGPIEEEIELAEEIADRIPCAEITRFTPSGTEAGMNVIRLARAYTRKKKIAKFEGGYHGTSDTLYISFLPKELGDSSKPSSTANSDGILDGITKNVITMPYNNILTVEKIIKENREDLAAVIIEPVMPRSGAGGGLILPGIDFLQSLREITKQYGILLIFDEVITGFRLARGGAQEYYNVIPDLSILGKVIGGGYPIGAVTGEHEIMKLVTGSSHAKHGKSRVPISGTFSGHPVSVAAGLATLECLTADIYELFEENTKRIIIGFQKALTHTGLKAHVSGINSLFNISFTDRKEIKNYRDTLTASATLFHYFSLDLFSKGVYWAPGHFSNLSTVTTGEDIKRAINAFHVTLETLKPQISNISPELLINNR